MNSPHASLREWRDGDLESLIALHHHPEVHPWLGGLQSREMVCAIYERLRDQLEQVGWGAWVIRNDDDELIGVAGLDVIREGMPVSGVEALWRMNPDYWGRGLVTQCMRAVLYDAFNRCGLDEVWTYTAHSNLRSQAVMERLGFQRAANHDFNHPKLAADHPLNRHLVYRMETVPGAEQ